VSAGNLDGKVAVVIGSATGIGAGSAKKLAERGAAVVLADIAIETARERAAEIVASGGRAVAVACDVRDEGDVERAIQTAVETFGGLDILHNNAAAMHLVGDDGPVATETAEHWDETFAVNLRGQMFGCKHAIPAMIARGGGSIINTSSASGVLGDLRLSAYGAAKSAINQLTREVATQYGRSGIRCNAVLPGLIEVDRPAGRGMTPEERARLVDHHVLPFVGRAEDVANAVAFLASDDARFITGALLAVDGGLTTHQPTYADALRSA
jgi:NAD(P)-dependent dehydrogenase (short-subunit alcohol dehydrogenase family)